MQPRISLVTLGVADVARARAFYERLGWVASARSNAEVAFFQAGGTIIALWGRANLAADAGVADAGTGFRGVALAWNGHSRAEVDAVLALAESAGARITRPAAPTEWGGYSGYFADPDGHAWEVAHNPGFPLDAQGAVRLPD
jgi:catechol 2,3-dioxygenase-like lactoylglutathione lyase family enzyme